jgi:hypothetical protein
VIDDDFDIVTAKDDINDFSLSVLYGRNWPDMQMVGEKSD